MNVTQKSVCNILQQKQNWCFTWWLPRVGRSQSLLRPLHYPRKCILKNTTAPYWPLYLLKVNGHNTITRNKNCDLSFVGHFWRQICDVRIYNIHHTFYWSVVCTCLQTFCVGHPSLNNSFWGNSCIVNDLWFYQVTAGRFKRQHIKTYIYSVYNRSIFYSNLSYFYKSWSVQAYEQAFLNFCWLYAELRGLNIPNRLQWKIQLRRVGILIFCWYIFYWTGIVRIIAIQSPIQSESIEQVIGRIWCRTNISLKIKSSYLNNQIA